MMNHNLVWNPTKGLTSNAEKVKEVGRVIPVPGNLVICCKFLKVSSTKLCAWPLKHPTGKVNYSNRLQLPVSAVVGEKWRCSLEQCTQLITLLLGAVISCC